MLEHPETCVRWDCTSDHECWAERMNNYYYYYYPGMGIRRMWDFHKSESVTMRLKSLQGGLFRQRLSASTRGVLQSHHRNDSLRFWVFYDLVLKRRTDECIRWTSLTFEIIFQIDSGVLARAIFLPNQFVTSKLVAQGAKSLVFQK